MKTCTSTNTDIAPNADSENRAKHIQITGDDQTSILELLALSSSLTKSTIKTAAQKGAVWLSKLANKPEQKTEYPNSAQSIDKTTKTKKAERIRRLKRPLKSHEQVDFYYNPDVLESVTPEAQCLFDGKEYSVWLKPRGMFSQGSKWGDFSALYRWVELYFQNLGEPRQSWIVHRLDRATRGLMIIAHSKSMARDFSQQFEQGKIHKIYQANVRGNFLKTITTIDSHIPAGGFQIVYENQSQQISHILVTDKVDGKDALSEISMLHYCAENDISRLKITLHTGRKHQIRKHLAFLNSPIIGDRLYGNIVLSEPESISLDAHDLQLTAYSLSWTCPLDNQLKEITLSEHQLDLLSCQNATVVAS